MQNKKNTRKSPYTQNNQKDRSQQDYRDNRDNRNYRSDKHNQDYYDDNYRNDYERDYARDFEEGKDINRDYFSDRNTDRKTDRDYNMNRQERDRDRNSRNQTSYYDDRRPKKTYHERNFRNDKKPHDGQNSQNSYKDRKPYSERKPYNHKDNRNFKTKHPVYKSVAHGRGYENFLPMNRADMEARSWKELDILFISGDAYIDHPAFAAAILGRHLESHGFRVGIITQPDWKAPNINEIIQEMGRPRLFAAVSAGAMDSMLAHYTAFRKKRHDDAYTSGGDCGARPNRAVAVYTNLLRQAFPHLPVISGGIESSLRRLSHFDFWTDSLRKSIVADAKLDLVLYGMGERAILETAQKLQEFYRRHPELTWDSEIIQKSKNKKPWQDTLAHIDGSARIIKSAEIVKLPYDTVILPSHNDIEKEPKLLIEATLLAEKHIHHANHLLLQMVDANRAILVEKPAKPLTEKEMDILYDLPYTRVAHPRYASKDNTTNYKGAIPAEKMMLSSMTCHRGCGGGCSFCSLALHQGRHISSRSRHSLLNEAQKLAKQPFFDGAISDVGGPSANMWQATCALKQKNNSQETDTILDNIAKNHGKNSKRKHNCDRVSCMTPKICPHFKIDQNEHLNLLREIKKIHNINHVRVSSGVRFDLALTQKDALNDYTGEFTGGQLKVAPEHCSPEVLELMRKPQMDNFEIFLEAFYGYCRKMDKEQYVIPYLLSAFPGCTDEHMVELANWLSARNWKPQQVQCFVPTPGTLASAMFYAECDSKGNPIFVAKSDAQRLRQHGILMGTTKIL